MKFKVRSPEHSAAIQRRLFELGYSWSNAGATVTHVNELYLFTSCAGKITYGSTHNSYMQGAYETTTLDDLYEPKLTLTIAEIAEKFGVDPAQIEIK